MKTVTCVLALIGIGLFLASASGCAAGGGGGGGGGQPPANENANTGDNANDNAGADNVNENAGGDNVNDNAGGEQPALVKTRISLGPLASALHRIEAGDDLVVFASPEGIFYVVPTQSDNTTDTAAEIPNSAALFGTRNWKAVGKKVALVRTTNEVAIFDTRTGAAPVDIPGGDITLHPLPVEPYGPGHMTSDGQLIATINDTNVVTDGNAIKVIDVSGNEPAVTSFPTPADFQGTFDQVAVDAATRTVAAHGDNPGDLVYVFDMDDPQAAPLSFDFFDRSGFTDNIQMRFDGAHILHRLAFEDRTVILNLADDSLTLFPENNEFNPNSPVALRGGSFGYFLAREDADAIYGANGTVYRSAIGTVADAPDATQANQLDYIDASDPALGQYGYGSTVAITTDGTRWFIAGDGPIDNRSDVLQMSTGGRFNVFTDPDGDTATGRVMATDVSCSDNTVAFWALRQTNLGSGLPDDDWVVGFIVLDRLTD